MFPRYKYHFPFLETNGIVTVDDNRVGPLYKHIFPPAFAPSLSFVGLPWKVKLRGFVLDLSIYILYGRHEQNICLWLALGYTILLVWIAKQVDRWCFIWPHFSPFKGRYECWYWSFLLIHGSLLHSKTVHSQYGWQSGITSAKNPCRMVEGFCFVLWVISFALFVFCFLRASLGLEWG